MARKRGRKGKKAKFMGAHLGSKKHSKKGKKRGRGKKR